MPRADWKKLALRAVDDLECFSDDQQQQRQEVFEMTFDVNTLVQSIKDVQEAIVGNEGNIVLNYVRVGELLIQLKRATPTEWEQKAQELGYNPRVARRHMALGRSWWRGDGLKQSGVLHLIPPDLGKIEWLVKLSRDQLVSAINHWPCRKWSRTQVVDAVKHELKIIDKSKSLAPVTADRMADECERFVERWVEIIQDAGPEMSDPETRQRLLDEIAARFAKLENLLASGLEDDSHPTDATASGTVQPEQNVDQGQG